jgi:hypothetical protein
MKYFLGALYSALLSLSLLGTAYAAVPGKKAVAAPSVRVPPKPISACGALKEFDLTDIGGEGSRVTNAIETNRDGVAVCAVDGILAPAIGFRLTLPLRGWTQRYLQVGCGGLCGQVPEEVGAAEGCTPLNTGGFAIGATDMGHRGVGGEFGRNPGLREDFAYRAQHLTAVAAKELIRAFYGRRQSYAYFNGCSDGGREALIEAQRYPGDFNGIIAGAPAMNFQVQNGLYHAWQAAANTGPDGKPVLLASRLALLHKAVLAQCDSLDGLVDGLITDPRACHFDPGVLQCTAAAKDTAECLTPTEVATVHHLYAGPHDPVTGEALTPGGPQPGSELAWAGVFVPLAIDQPIMSEKISLDALLNLSFKKNPATGTGLAAISFDKAGLDSLRPLHPLYDATNPDLTRFMAGGGKLILWHGWADPHISPLTTIAYQEAVEGFLGPERTDTFERLFLLPGVYHCSGGEGPSLVDFLTPMMAWVENAQAPDEIIVTQAAGGHEPGSFGQAQWTSVSRFAPKPRDKTEPVIVENARTRPVYPYPEIAAYAGKGDINEASSYMPVAPIFTGTTAKWAGSDLFAPYQVYPALLR